jgi:hypothetical protein
MWRQLKSFWPEAEPSRLRWATSRSRHRHCAASHAILSSNGVTSLFVAFKLLPDSYAGPEGTPTNYISFDIATAERLRADLDLCIDEYHRLSGAVT